MKPSRKKQRRKPRTATTANATMPQKKPVAELRPSTSPRRRALYGAGEKSCGECPYYNIFSGDEICSRMQITTKHTHKICGFRRTEQNEQRKSQTKSSVEKTSETRNSASEIRANRSQTLEETLRRMQAATKSAHGLQQLPLWGLHQCREITSNVSPSVPSGESADDLGQPQRDNAAAK